MSLEQIADRVVETDVLVVGGGIAGCPAAIKAAEHGLEVTLAEKSKPERSGMASQGIDHCGEYPREGVTLLDLVGGWEGWQRVYNGDGRWFDPNVIYTYYENALWALEELEKLGIPMKWDDGKYYWMTGPSYKEARCMLRVHWQNVKPQMAAEVRKRGVNVLERVMVTDILTSNGQVVGATAIDTRSGDFIVIKAKAIVMTTGILARCYDPETPLFWKYKFRYHWCPASVSGDGWAMAYRAGAELVNMDITGWGFRTRDDLTISFGNLPLNEGIPAKVLNSAGEEIAGVRMSSASKYAKIEQEGTYPIYSSIEDLPDDYHKRIEVAYVDERIVSFKIAEDRGFNPRTHRYELMPNKPHNFQVPDGISVDEDFKASLKGLYSAGECATALGGCGVSSATGLIVGDRIHNFVSEAGEPVIDEAQVESQKQAALAPLSVKDGTEPMELESAIRYICHRYVGQLKSEGKLREGLRRLGSLRRVFLPQLIAKNPHYLMRCLEVRNIMDLAELHIQACLERKETRGNHIRLDYPDQDPSRDSMITYQRMEDGKPVLEIRKPPELKPEYAKEEK